MHIHYMQTVIHILRATADIAAGPLRLQVLFDVYIECFHVTSWSGENHTGDHFGVQLNGDLVCCMMCMQMQSNPDS